MVQKLFMQTYTHWVTKIIPPEQSKLACQTYPARASSVWHCADDPHSKQIVDLANCSYRYCGWEFLAWTGPSALAIQTIIWALIFHELNNASVEWEALTASWNGKRKTWRSFGSKSGWVSFQRFQRVPRHWGAAQLREFVTLCAVKH